MMNELNEETVAVIFGGNSNEHEVSLVSAYNVLSMFKKTKFKPIAIGITKQGKWFKFDGDFEKIKDGSWEKGSNCKEIVVKLSDDSDLLKVNENGVLKPLKISYAFPIVHGNYGEDGKLQSFLEMLKIKYAGCKVLSSNVCFDKILSRIVAQHHEINQTKWQSISKKDSKELKEQCEQIAKELKFPIFVKPSRGGSSIGISKCNNIEELIEGVKKAFKVDFEVLLEEGVIGKEIECAVIGYNEIETSPVLGQIKVKGEKFYDYDEKYSNESEVELIVPAELDQKEVVLVRQFVKKVYFALRCEGFARVDCFVKANGEILFNEVNTLPGFTEISMFPKLWEASGLTNSELLEKIIEQTKIEWKDGFKEN